MAITLIYVLVAHEIRKITREMIPIVVTFVFEPFLRAEFKAESYNKTNMIQNEKGGILQLNGSADKC
jgi:hypothetical protein